MASGGWWRRLLGAVSFSKQSLKGIDIHGNRYYEIITKSGKLKRSIKVHKSTDPTDYTGNTIPPEWSRWLHGLEEHPPTEEEQKRRLAYNEMMKQKIHNLEMKQKEENLNRDNHSSNATKEADKKSAKYEPLPWKP